MPTQPRRQPKKRRNGRKLLFLVLAIGILGFGWVHIVHGSSTAKRPHHSVVTCTRSPRSHKRVCTSHQTLGHKQVTPASRLHSYAVHLVPVLKRTRSAFDGAAAATQATDLDTLDGVCGSYGTQIAILSEEADGVPHPGPWYQPVSELHHSLLGLFHDMLGALQTCQTASENGDYYTVAIARDDIASAAQRMHSTDDYAVWLSHKR